MSATCHIAQRKDGRIGVTRWTRFVEANKIARSLHVPWVGLMRSVVLALVMFVFLDSPANAAGKPEDATGLIAERCANCHKVPGFTARWEQAQLNAPPFLEIAKNPDVYTPARLRAFLQKPHWPMTQFILSPSDIDNILAFIGHLRSRNAPSSPDR